LAFTVSRTIRGVSRIALALAIPGHLALVPTAAASADPRWVARYRQACADCHDKGKSKRPDARGAPRLGDSRAWESRIAKGREAMYKRLLTAPHGREIPESRTSEWRGGLGDAEIGSVLDYMLEQLP
jgi:cytochrome c5